MTFPHLHFLPKGIARQLCIQLTDASTYLGDASDTFGRHDKPLRSNQGVEFDKELGNRNDAPIRLAVALGEAESEIC